MTRGDTPLTLLLDFDGTLVPIGPTPDDIEVTEEVRALVAEAAERLDGRVALISGRSLDQLDELWGRSLWPVTVAASHGLELRHDGHRRAPPRANIFPRLIREIEMAFPAGDGVVIELKSFGVGLHYRLAPGRREAVCAWAQERAAEHDLIVQPGDMVFELRLPGADKGDAVRTIIGLPQFVGSRPFYIGDDLSDIPGIAAARASGGSGIAVGERIAAYADEVVPSPAAVHNRIRALLSGAAKAYNP